MDGSMHTYDSTCDRLEEPNPLTVTLAAIITVGILVSYVPQHVKIIRKGTSEGLSPWWILLGGLSSIAALGNILTLPASRQDMNCCRSIGLGSCVAALLGVVQIGMQFTCFMLIVMLFVAYASVKNAEASTTATDSPPNARRQAVLVSFITLAGALFTLVASVIFVSAVPQHAQGWANFLGTVAGTLAAVQYLPQIYYTYHLGDVKSLSLVTMTIQVPGAFLFALSLWLRVGWEGWSAWAVYIVTAILQGTLFALAIGFTLRDRKARKGDVASHYEENDEQDTNGTRNADERTSLLPRG